MPICQRPGRQFACTALACAALSILPSNAAAGQSAPPPAETPLGRWLALDQARVGVRYRVIRDGAGQTIANQIQAQEVARGRVRLDAGGRVGVGFTLQTGTGFPGAWNSTGIGTGEPRAAVYLKHLYADVTPIAGLSIQYGGLGVVHGENSEITSYDNDGYLVGGRAALRMPRRIFFDEVSVTVGYLGDLTTTNVLRRLDSLDSQNFVQAIVVKHVTQALSLSASYADDDIEGGVWRQGVRLSLDRAWADALRLEYAVRTDTPHETSSAATVEKAVRRVTLTGGFAQVGRRLGVLNADRYGIGSGVFGSAAVKLPADMTATVWIRRQIRADESTPNKLRVDAAIVWDILRTLRRRR